MNKPIPLEVEDPELGELLQNVCEYNSKRLKKDRIVVDFDADAVYERTRKANKVGRNEPCPCGSNKKYKKCCAK
jgi:uncharacterized protein YecA (UPF0149 family)